MTVFERPGARTPMPSLDAARWETAEGWKLASIVSSSDQERAAVEQAIGLVDLSAFVKIGLRGDGVSAIGAALAPGSELEQPRRVAWFDADGAHLACRLTDDHLLLLASGTSAAALRGRLVELSQQNPRLVEQDVSCAFAGFGLVGPHHEKLLQPLTPLNLSRSALPPGSCAETSWANVHALLVRPPRMRVTATLLYVSWDLGEYVGETLAAHGRPLGLEPIGLETWRGLIE